jgi:hypothetical protein
MVCDLQGVGAIVTDPQIVDLDPEYVNYSLYFSGCKKLTIINWNSCWADGNNSCDGIDSFLSTHKCHPGNVVCEALNLKAVKDLAWKKPAPQSQADSLAHILASRNRDPSPSSNYFPSEVRN